MKNPNARVCFIVPSLKSSGPTNQLFMIAEQAAQKFEVEIVTLHGEAAETSQRMRFVDHGFSVLNLSSSPFNGYWRLWNYLKAREPDVIQSHGFISDLFLALLPLRCPWVATIRNNPFDDYPSKFGIFLGYTMAVLHLMALFLCKNPIACSATIGDFMASKRIYTRVIRNGVSPRKSKKQKVENATPPYPFFLIIGSLIKRKNNEKIIPAFLRLRDKITDLRLVFLGNGPEEKNLKMQLGDAGIFTGHVNDVYGWLDAASAFVSLSRSEGMPNAVLEALNARKKCILSDIGPHRELQEMFPNLITLVPLDITDHALASEMFNFIFQKENAKKSIKTEVISGELMGKTYVELYGNLMPSH
jgi:glycosyltransferase involved in cell wall biosynthesis